MTDRGRVRVLWLALLVLLPLPHLGVELASIPALRQWLLAALTGVFMLVESRAGIGPLLLPLFAGQALIASLLCLGLAWGTARVLRLLAGPWRDRALAGLIAVWLLLAIALPIYTTPYSGVAPRCTLLEVYR